jgi:23S rRNA (uracil1939-C5)-methyltransferase
MILDSRVNTILSPIREIIQKMKRRKYIPQIEVACGDDSMAIVIRHLQPLNQEDHHAWLDFSKKHHVLVYLQPKGPKTLERITPMDSPILALSYKLPDYDCEFLMEPLDFSQVNAAVNRKMIALALRLLALNKTDRVLDLFCGLGNFTLPIARSAQSVVGIEGNQMMVERGKMNAKHNHLNNVSFYQADLTKDVRQFEWAKQSFNKLLIDPARSGAQEVMDAILYFSPEKIVYVSCNPATLARDSGILVQSGYQLSHVGVMDMFSQTSHVESIALFERL